MEAVELAELDLHALAAFTDRQRELDLEAGQGVLQVVELDRDQLAAGQILAGLEASRGRAAAEVAEHGDADRTLRGPGRRRCVELAEIGDPIVVFHACSRAVGIAGCARPAQSTSSTVNTAAP